MFDHSKFGSKFMQFDDFASISVQNVQFMAGPIQLKSLYLLASKTASAKWNEPVQGSELIYLYTFGVQLVVSIDF